MNEYSITYMNLITEQAHTKEIDSLNYMCVTMLGGSGGHKYNIDAIKEICSLLGYSTAFNYDLEGLNIICVGGGGTGGHKYLIDAWKEIQQGSLLNLLPIGDYITFEGETENITFENELEYLTFEGE